MPRYNPHRPVTRPGSATRNEIAIFAGLICGLALGLIGAMLTFAIMCITHGLVPAIGGAMLGGILGALSGGLGGGYVAHKTSEGPSKG